MKRENEYEVDPKNLDEIKKKNVETDVASPQEIAQRKIIKVARAQNNNEPHPKINVKIDLGAEPSTQQIANKQQNLNNDHTDSKQADNKTEEKGENKKPNNLFSSLNLGSNLFNNNNINNNSTPKDQNQAKASAPAPSLFNFSLPTGSSNLFSNLLTNQTGLFSSSGPSLFDFKNHTPPTSALFQKNQASDDQGADNDNPDQQESAEIDQSKVINDYVYQNPYTKLIQKQLVKSKRDSDEAIQNTTASLEKHNQTGKVWLFIRTKQTKTILFQGQLVAKVSNIKIINNKSQNLNASVLEVKDKKPKVASIKMQFLSNQQGNQFIKVFENNIDGQSTPK